MWLTFAPVGSDGNRWLRVNPATRCLVRSAVVGLAPQAHMHDFMPQQGVDLGRVIVGDECATSGQRRADPEGAGFRVIVPAINLNVDSGLAKEVHAIEHCERSSVLSKSSQTVLVDVAAVEEGRAKFAAGAKQDDDEGSHVQA